MDTMIIRSRDLGSAQLTGNNFSPAQRQAQQILTIVVAGVSILTGATCLYWFFRMRTHFRHHLIILLIFADLFKAIWYFIPAAIGLAGYQKSPSPAFCQASGFLLAWGVEAADFAVLIVAVHSALCIFKPRTSLGESGLFGVRHIVYALWFIIPVIMASLGLMQGGVYIGQGAFCYLPVRPFWYRLGLAWIPRYLIFMTILGLYIRIYWFVSKKFKQYDLDSDGSHKLPSDHRTFHSVAQPKPDTAKLASTVAWADGSNGGGPSTTGSVAHSTTPLTSQVRAERTQSDDLSRRTSGNPTWENYTFGSPTRPIPPPEADDIAPLPPRSSLKASSLSDDATIAGSSPTAGLAAFLKETGPEIINTPSSPTKTAGFASEVPSQNAATPSAARPTARPKLPDRPDSQYVTAEGMRTRHTAIKRQLRFLFVYPLFYLISWLVPLAQHITLYWDSIASHPIFGLSCASTVFLALQCTIDCVIFSTRETPWRYVRLTSGSNRDSEATTALDANDTCCGLRWDFWRRQHREPESSGDDPDKLGDLASPTSPSSPSLFKPFSFQSSSSPTSPRPRSTLSLPLRSSKIAGSGAGGKSKGEMVAESRAARARREVELSSAQEKREEVEKKRKMSLMRRGGSDRAWWEVEGKMRKDSVLLGTDAQGEKASEGRLEGRKPSEDEQSAQRSDDDRGSRTSNERTPMPTVSEEADA